MKNLLSYDLLEEIRNTYFNENSTQGEITNRLEEATKKLQATLAEDFRTIFGETFIFKKHIIYFDDPNYRQSSTGIYFSISPENEPHYLISIECLIDHSRIYIKSKNEPIAKISNHIANKIIKMIADNNEDHAELCDLQI